MPELPEVESFGKYIRKTSLHKKIEVVKLTSPLVLQGITARKLTQALEGNMFEDTQRHGKFLFVELKKNGYLMLHFGLTGDLEYFRSDETPPRFAVLMLHFADGHTLAFTDSRKLGKITLVDDVEKFIEKRGYGKDALKISDDEFLKLFSKRKVAIKTALMNQKIIAGVGNEFSDEILFQCKIHPESVSNKLSEAQLRKIYKETVSILKEAVKHNAERSKLEHYFFLDNRKAGLKCPRCKGETEFKTIGGRSAYFCPSCQKLYK